MKNLSTPMRWALLVAAVLMSVPARMAAQTGVAKHVLVLHWDNKDHPANVEFDRYFEANLRSAAPEDIEIYPEFLESNRFPGENQSVLLRDYLRQKYADRRIDVVVANASPPVDFLLRNRDSLFPDAPIVFAATERPSPAALASGAGATGIVYVNSHRRTVEMALRFHPDTKQLFVVCGMVGGDRSFETVARDQLRGLESRLAITYLTDLPLGQLKARLRSLPETSIVLYVWQQDRNQQGGVMASQTVLASLASVQVPIYGMSAANVGLGIVGGYVWTYESNTARLAEITLRVANGARPASIPIEGAPEVPMFDWRQLQRWKIRDDQLPPASVIRFREFTMWQQYKWRIVSAIFVFVVQALLIGALLVERRRARRSQKELLRYHERLEDLVQQRTAELVEARDQAVAANRSKSMFLAKMSHELRTPLSAILGFSGMVLKDASLSDQHRKDLSIVGSSGEHLLGLIDDVLDMAKIESGGTALQLAAIDLHSLVNDAVNMFREQAQSKNLELRLDVSSQAPRFVRSDPAKLRQVLTNLVGNALKYTDEGSVLVGVRARPADSSAPIVLIFDVEDTGIGISAEDQARIFEAFVQAGNPRERKGVGLGLSITRHFLQLLGGTLRVESTPGHGSRFHVEIPAQVVDSCDVMEAVSEPGQVIGLEPGQPGYRILIVEDHKENWLLLQRLLETVGFEVRVAEDGGKAIDAFSSWLPHFIWMDLRLPVLDGLEAARRIRRMDGGHAVKIVAVTASAFASQREEVLAAGFDDFLRKPYRPREIFECMARHLGVRYVYGASPQSPAGEAPATLRPEDLAALPAALRDELENAVVSLNPKHIAAVVRQISEQNAALGSVLGHLAGGLLYTSIHDALQNCKAAANIPRVRDIEVEVRQHDGPPSSPQTGS